MRRAPHPQAGEEGGGTLLLVVGPSGSGKDTLINWLKDRLGDDPSILFVKRTVTRSADADVEDHTAMTPEDFAAAKAAGQFSITWKAHGLSYGLPARVEQHLAGGGIAIANGSRHALDAMRRRFADVVVVHLEVDRHVLARRLAVRGRESAREIEARLSRSDGLPELGDGVIALDNSGPIETAGQAMLALVQDIVAGKSAPA